MYKRQFEDRANGYAIGDYKKRPNMIGIYETVLPSQVSDEMSQLLAWYNNQDIFLEILAEFYALSLIHICILSIKEMIQRAEWII